MCLSRRYFNSFAVAAALVLSDSVVEPSMRLVLPPGVSKTVALTLDACSGATDWRILSELDRLSVPATIFATGLWFRTNDRAVAWLRDRPHLFSVQNHGARHLPAVLGTRRIYGLPVAGSFEAIQAEVTLGGEAVASHVGVPAKWYRAAAGRYSESAIERIETMGFAIAGYSRNADAGASLPAESVARRIGAAVTGDVIIAHVNQPNRASGAGVAEGVSALRATGTEFVRLDQYPTQLNPSARPT